MGPLIADCVGLWRRTLLIGADGARDTGDGVTWLQGIAAYVDSRGFAGRLHQSGEVFSWHRDVDLEPPGPFPDEGSMRWEGEVLVETGVHEDYVEHWVRAEGSAGPSGAAFLAAPDGAGGLLMRVGELFGWAGAGAVVIGPVGGPEWARLEIDVRDDDVDAAGMRWNIQASEGNLRTWPV